MTGEEREIERLKLRADELHIDIRKLRVAVREALPYLEAGCKAADNFQTWNVLASLFHETDKWGT